MKCFNSIRILAAAVLIHCGFDARGEVPPPDPKIANASRVSREILQKWIAHDMHFFNDSGTSSRLFLRREPVRAGIILGGIPIKEEVDHLIGQLSKAAGVTYELTSTDVNLAIVVDTPINDGDKPNPKLWKRVGLSDELYSIASESGNWASGCGIYSFGNRQNGQVGLSITFADSKLEPADIRECVIEGTIRSFGFRMHRKSTLRTDDGYIQFVALAKALNACEKSIGVERLASMPESEQKQKYVECAADFLER